MGYDLAGALLDNPCYKSRLFAKGSNCAGEKNINDGVNWACGQLRCLKSVKGVSVSQPSPDRGFIRRQREKFPSRKRFEIVADSGFGQPLADTWFGKIVRAHIRDCCTLI